MHSAFVRLQEVFAHVEASLALSLIKYSRCVRCGISEPVRYSVKCKHLK